MILILRKLPFQNMKHLLSVYLNASETPSGSLQEKYTLEVQLWTSFSPEMPSPSMDILQMSFCTIHC